ncbi:MAG TPA: FAD-dependent oxidoreductase [Bryobacteraceae bacterium]|nr:FAD-dependent oxidoreductase [Bryobacteraceae bacterium]
MPTNVGSGNLPTVVIIGAGAAGVFSAYQISKRWPSQFNVQLFEASPTIGGNVSSLTVSYGGKEYIIDAGAQFFYSKAQPNYVNLIQEIGLGNDIASYPAGFTIWDKAANQRLLWIPSLVSGFLRYTADDWARVIQFGGFLVAAALLNRVGQPDWTLSVDDWLTLLPLTDDFKQNVIKNFLYQFVSLPYGSIGTASAVYATTYFVRNVLGGSTAAALDLDFPTFETNQSLVGLSGVLRQTLKASGVLAQTNSPVTAVAPADQGVAVTVNGRTIHAQHVVMACDPGASATLLANGGTADPNLIGLLKGLGNQYLNLSIIMQRDGSCWMPSDQNYWEPVITMVNSSDSHSVAFSAWFGPLRPPYGDNQLIPVFKSWGSPNLAGCTPEFFSHVHNVLLPTTTFMQLRSQLSAYQNRNGLMFAGGWTDWFDTQEAALLSAMNVAQMLQPPGGATPSSSAVGFFDPRVIPGQVKSWMEMALRSAPEPYKSELVELVKKLE